jgi:flagellar M-ring protein FliF
VQAQLERVVGPGNADVRINVDLNSASTERTEEHFEPAKTALRSEHKVEELTGAAGSPGVAGVPGATSNLPDAKPEGEGEAEQTTASGPGGTVRRTHTRNWEVDKVTQKTMLPPGDIERLSVAVLLNGHYETRGKKQVYVARTKQEVAELEEVIKRAVGYQAERGDTVRVATSQFARIPGAEEEQEQPALPNLRRWAPVAAAGLGLLALAVVVLIWRQKAKKKKARVQAVAHQLASPPFPAALAEGDAQAPTHLLEEAVADAVDTRARALELASKDPATAAIVLRKWLNAPTAAAIAARS